MKATNDFLENYFGSSTQRLMDSEMLEILIQPKALRRRTKIEDYFDRDHLNKHSSIGVVQIQ